MRLNISGTATYFLEQLAKNKSQKTYEVVEELIRQAYFNQFEDKK